MATTTTQFAVHGPGGSQLEVLLLNCVPPFAILIRNLIIPWTTQGHQFDAFGASYWWKFLLDFIFIACPVIASMTCLADYLGFLFAGMLVFIITMFLFISFEYSMVVRERLNTRLVMNRLIEEHHSPTMFLTYFRGSIFISVAIAILAVDFSVFPRRFAKTEGYGHSLMDTGVAAFICCQALAGPLKTSSRREESEARRARRRFPAVYSSTFILVLLGASRTVVLEALQYPYELSEYGRHWNFFYTLAAVTLVSYLLPQHFHIIAGLFFAAVHQSILSSGAQEWLMDESGPREDLLSANREGICSLLGYLALFYLSRAVGMFIAKTGIRLRSWAVCSAHLLLIGGICRCLQFLAELAVGEPSRRLVNLPYILAMLSLFCCFLSLHMMVQVVALVAWAAKAPHFGTEENPFARSQPCMLEAVNRHGLAFFLLANLSTGLVNICAGWMTGGPTHQMGQQESLGLLTLHTALCCAVAHALSAQSAPSHSKEHEEEREAVRGAP